MKRFDRSRVGIFAVLLMAGLAAGCASTSESSDTPAPGNDGGDQSKNEFCTVECASFAGEGFAAEYRDCMDECLSGGSASAARSEIGSLKMAMRLVSEVDGDRCDS